jgi:hypothetical protein
MLRQLRDAVQQVPRLVLQTQERELPPSWMKTIPPQPNWAMTFP